MSKVLEITSESDFRSHLSLLPSSTLLVLSFHAPWAAPCAQMATILSTLAATYPVKDPPTVSFVSINAEELPEISEDYDVTAVPFLALVRDAKTLETVSGSDAAKVRAAIERHVGSPSSSSSSSSAAGRAGIPAALPVTPRTANGNANGESALGPGGSGGGAAATAAAKNLSSYAPTSTDPQTAPEMTSSSSTTATATMMTSAPPSKEELHERLSNLVKAAPVMLFMKGTPSAPQCGFSRQLVGLLREKTVKYGFFNILADEDVRQGLKEFADWPTFPQLWVGGELVGGLDIVKEELAADPDFLATYSANNHNTKVNGSGPGSVAAEPRGEPATATT